MTSEDERQMTVDEIEQRLQQGDTLDIQPDGTVLVRQQPTVLDVVIAARALGPTNY